MIDALPLLLGPEGYQISRSVRLRSSATASFSRTPASASNRKTWTWSGWVKRGNLGNTNPIFGAEVDAGTLTSFNFNSTGALRFYRESGSVVFALGETTAVYRDTSAWYHIVCAYDSTQATLANRLKIYVNEVQQAFTWSTNLPIDHESNINNNQLHSIGTSPQYTASFDGYLTEINFIDGQALDPSSFGETNLVTGVWQPKKYAGTYGTNGFFLNFADNSAATAAAIGKDSSGNGNNWTPTNISVTAGASYDSMLDVPTQWADGGNGRGNYCVINPLTKSGGDMVVSQGNLAVSGASGATASAYFGSVPIPDKAYFEVTATDSGGVGQALLSVANASNTLSFVKWIGNGGDYTTYGTYAAAVDKTNGKIWLRNSTGAWIGGGDPVAGTLPTGTLTMSGEDFFARGGNSRTSGFNGVGGAYYNFGQRPFSYSPPTGFKALNTLNLPTPTILKGNQYFDATTYTGTGAARSVTNAGGFQPDLVWMKDRGNVVSHILFDVQRGTNNFLRSNTTDAATTNTTMLTAFNSNGFSLGTDSAGAVNVNTNSYVGWQWKEGPTQGFDIVTYTGTGVNRTVAHSLGVAPKMMIVKQRSGAQDWVVYHSAIGNTGALFLQATSATTTSSLYWNNTSPTGSVFTVGTGNGTNANTATYVAYLFSEVAGFSAFGRYTGNGSADGPMIFTGFLPRFVMWKRTDAVGDWLIEDSARDVGNAATAFLIPNKSNAEATGIPVDFLSNGFKIRTTNADTNTNGATYIYAAFSSNPFKNSLAR